MGYTIFNAFRCTCSHFQNSIMYQIMFTVILEKSLILSWKGWKCENWVSYRIYQAFSFYIMTWYECQVYPGFLIFVFISIITVRANLTVLHAMSWYDTTSLKLISFKRACSNNCWWTCWQRLWVIIITKKLYFGLYWYQLENCYNITLESHNHISGHGFAVRWIYCRSDKL